MKKFIHKTAIACAMLLLPLAAFSQGTRPSPPSKVSKTVGGTEITISYNQPSVRERTIWGELVPYGRVWRTGANEATVIEFNKDVKIGDKTLKPGKYSIFTIPEQNEWTFIINEETGQWGTRYNAEKDVVRVKATPKTNQQMTEAMTFEIEDDGTVNLMWEKLKVGFKVTPASTSQM